MLKHVAVAAVVLLPIQLFTPVAVAQSPGTEARLNQLLSRLGNGAAPAAAGPRVLRTGTVAFKFTHDRSIGPDCDYYGTGQISHPLGQPIYDQRKTLQLTCTATSCTGTVELGYSWPRADPESVVWPSAMVSSLCQSREDSSVFINFAPFKVPPNATVTTIKVTTVN
jgi:hypothetical protein